MFKVILKVERLSLKIKNVDCQIVAKKDRFTIPLSPVINLYHGQVTIHAQTQFLIVQNDPLLLIQVLLNCPGSKKLGGELSLNIGEWDENVHHSTIASLQKSPDRNSQICYTFVYIKKDFIPSEKLLILCSEYRDKNLTEMEGKKNELTKRQNSLQNQIQKLKEENFKLQTNQKIRKEEISNKKIDFDQKIKNCQQTIDKNNQAKISIRRKNDQIVRIIQQFGQEQIKKQLYRKYPPQYQEIKLETEDKMKEQKTERIKKNQSLIESFYIRKYPQGVHTINRQRSRQKKMLKSSKDD